MSSFILFAGAMAAVLQAAPLEATLADHVITYTDESGHRQRIDVGKPCDDLWVAPDESAFAFIGIDEYTDFPGPPEGKIAIATTIYIARRADHFTPKRIMDTVREGQAEFHQLYNPSISSDGAFVFFVAVPGNTGLLYAHNLQTGTNELLDSGGVRNLTKYCTVWSGRYAGGVYFMERYLADQPDSVFRERCYLRTPGKPALPASCSQLAPVRIKDGAACTQVPR
jgi:hypothetical protein